MSLKGRFAPFRSRPSKGCNGSRAVIQVPGREVVSATSRANITKAMKRALAFACLLALIAYGATLSPKATEPGLPALAPPAVTPPATSPPAGAPAPTPTPSLKGGEPPPLPSLENIEPPPDKKEVPAGPNLAWHTALEGDVVVVELTDATSHYRVEKLDLLGPDGIRITGGELTRLVEHRYGSSTEGPSGPFGLAVSGGSSSGVNVGIGINTPRPARNITPPPKTTTHARIGLPDPAAYRANAQAWKISAQLIDSKGETSFVEIPAPTP